MGAVPAPDGRPARPGWQASLFSVGYLSVWVVIGLVLYALAIKAWMT